MKTADHIARKLNIRMLIYLFLLHIPFNTVFARELTVVFGVSRPPFIMEKQPTGISYKLFELIAKKMPISFHPIFAPNARMQKIIQTGNFDIVVEAQKTDKNIFYSDPFIAYRNFAVTQPNVELNLSNYSGLQGKNVCAWQNAQSNLGSDFSSHIKSFAKYTEFPMQEKQVQSWMLGHCEVIIIDDTVLKWWVKSLIPKLAKRNLRMEMDHAHYYPLPGNNKLWWYVAFKNKQLRDHFNRALKEIKTSGEYDKIRDGFVDRYTTESQ